MSEEARDDHGRWTGGGGAPTVGPKSVEYHRIGAPKRSVDETLDDLKSAGVDAAPSRTNTKGPIEIASASTDDHSSVVAGRAHDALTRAGWQHASSGADPDGDSANYYEKGTKGIAITSSIFALNHRPAAYGYDAWQASMRPESGDGLKSFLLKDEARDDRGRWTGSGGAREVETRQVDKHEDHASSTGNVVGRLASAGVTADSAGWSGIAYATISAHGKTAAENARTAHERLTGTGWSHVAHGQDDDGTDVNYYEKPDVLGHAMGVAVKSPAGISSAVAYGYDGGRHSMKSSSLVVPKCPQCGSLDVKAAGSDSVKCGLCLRTSVVSRDFVEVVKYSDSQARDDHGRWTGSSSAGREASAQEYSEHKYSAGKSELQSRTRDKIAEHMPKGTRIDSLGGGEPGFVASHDDMSSKEFAHHVHDSLLKAGYTHVAHATSGRGSHTNYYEKPDAGSLSGISINHLSNNPLSLGYTYDASKHSMKGKS